MVTVPLKGWLNCFQLEGLGFFSLRPGKCTNCKTVLTKKITGSRGGTVVRALASHQCGPGSIPILGVICGLSLLVLYSAPRDFSPGTPVVCTAAHARNCELQFL